MPSLESNMNGDDKLLGILPLGGAKAPAREKYALFREKLGKTIRPTLPVKELAGFVVRAALEVEYGEPFTKSPFSDRMISTIADSIMTNPDLRQELLTVATTIYDARTNPVFPESFP